MLELMLLRPRESLFIDPSPNAVEIIIFYVLVLERVITAKFTPKDLKTSLLKPLPQNWQEFKTHSLSSRIEETFDIEEEAPEKSR